MVFSLPVQGTTMSVNRSSSRNRFDWTHVITALITAISTVLIAWLTVQGNAANIRQEMQGTITALQTTATQSSNQVITVTQIIEITPTPDEKILLLDSLPARMFAFFGGEDPEFQGYGYFSVHHTDSLAKEYILRYSLPEQGFTWAGISNQFNTTINFYPYSMIEVKAKPSNPGDSFQVKLVDKSEDAVYLNITNPPTNESGVSIIAQDGGILVQIPLRGNFDKLNLEQITEIGLVTHSQVAKGDGTFSFSGLKLTK
jgi:hypothetical protein